MFRSIALFLIASSFALAEESLSTPKLLLLRIEGFTGPSYRVELVPASKFVSYRSNSDTFTSAEGTKEEKVEISNEQWSAFWHHLDEAEVWKWKPRYVPSRNPPDGTVWTVKIEWNGRKVESTGTNAYPNARQFALLKAAVSELLGGRKFE